MENRSEYISPAKWRKMPLALMTAGLILVMFIGYLLYFNFKNHDALVNSSLKGFALDIEKHSASLGYFFIERKYDIRALAASQEVISYYTNKGMGMSETYGLKLNLFLISKLIQKFIGEKVISDDPVYQQIALADMDGKVLASAGKIDSGDRIPHVRVPRYDNREPVFYFGKQGPIVFLNLAVPVFYKNRTVGQIIAGIKLDTLYKHFMENCSEISLKGFALTDEEGALLCPEDNTYCSSFAPIASKQPPTHEKSGEFLYNPEDGWSSEVILFTRTAIPASPLYLSAWVRKRDIFGVIEPWQFYLSGAFFALVVLMGVGLLVRFSIKNSLLNARYEAAEKEQLLLENKNRQLSEEIQLREAAEKRLEIQKSIQIRSDRLRSLGEMAAGIAHELNQPLTGIRGMSELILFGIKNNSIEVGRISEITADIIGQTDRMAHIINHVRLFARKAGSADTSYIDLNKTIASALSLLSTQFTSHGLSIIKDMAQCALVIQANPYSLEEVVINIMNNARHAVESRKETAGNNYMPVICITTFMAEGAGHNSRAVLEIRDNGFGMSQETAEKIFEPFFTTKDPDKGTGLGMSICKSIVESFGGTIDFSTKEGEGTTFMISFRCASIEAPPVRAPMIQGVGGQ